MNKQNETSQVELRRNILEEFNSQKIRLDIAPNMIRNLLIDLASLNKLSEDEELGIKSYFGIDNNKSLLNELKTKRYYSRLRNIQNFFKENNPERKEKMDGLLYTAGILLKRHHEIFQLKNHSNKNQTANKETNKKTESTVHKLIINLYAESTETLKRYNKVTTIICENNLCKVLESLEPRDNPLNIFDSSLSYSFLMEGKLKSIKILSETIINQMKALSNKPDELFLFQKEDKIVINDSGTILEIITIY